MLNSEFLLIFYPNLIDAFNVLIYNTLILFWFSSGGTTEKPLNTLYLRGFVFSRKM